MPRSRLVDFNKFYYNLKVTRGGHKFQHESTGTRAQGTKAQVLDMLVLDCIPLYQTQFQRSRSSSFHDFLYEREAGSACEKLLLTAT